MNNVHRDIASDIEITYNERDTLLTRHYYDSATTDVALQVARCHIKLRVVDSELK